MRETAKSQLDAVKEEMRRQEAARLEAEKAAAAEKEAEARLNQPKEPQKQEQKPAPSKEVPKTGTAETGSGPGSGQYAETGDCEVIAGLGTDIVEIGRIVRMLDKFGDAFRERICTPAEPGRRQPAGAMLQLITPGAGRSRRPRRKRSAAASANIAASRMWSSETARPERRS